MENTNTGAEGRRSPKREAILSAATEAFLERGYETVSMDEIARAAGVSKQTVYNHFPNKETLFTAILRGECENFTNALSMAEIQGGEPAEVLADIGRAMLRALLNPKAMDLYRQLIITAPRATELGRAFYDYGPRHATRQLMAYLANATRDGRLAMADPELAAEMFLGMVTGTFQARGLLGLLGNPEDAEIDRRVNGAVAVFLRAHRAGLNPSGTPE